MTKLCGWMICSSIPAGAGDFSAFFNLQNGSGAHPVSSAKGTRSPLPECKVVRASPSNAEIRIIGVLLPLPYMPASCAQGQTYLHIYLFKNHVIDKVLIPFIYS